ncbi:MAG TPA: adenylate/guanylate cyclase domain-containing protein [Leptospiraceae bacterium]|nr:adenylate/guanylate cyclase domain-containing protein [Leptospiraceae bacterium]HMW05970.1 adenylate/guanylate cyclase domain-containing protein [Leptospiraceae bacterium]HMX32098.1 adenylate/guanylate cyclase domain-containing protein [Leptospiraceae bacterium]HMY32324.1 adenylate/guanylate cyclase domain-containing protein [Leptospiraceae bacterium]HMZ62474.1 adenylate/guanylate cyclase domain-containing protein [Leptospiraceae bacterium]
MKHIRPKFLEPLLPKIKSNYQDEFYRQMLVNEKKRVTIIASLIAFILFVQIILRFFIPDSLINKYPTALEGSKYSIAILFLFFIYEIVVRFIFSNFIKKDIQPPEFIRYGNAFVETSVPTLGMILFGYFQEPTDALVSPILLVYFFFILLSTLRLNFKLSLFTSFVAAAEYLGLCLYYYNTNQIKSLNMMSIELPLFYLRSCFFLIGGGISGLVAVQIREGFLKSIETIEEKKQLMNVFGQHVSPEVVDKLLNQNVDIDSEIKHVCVMFLDIRNFTSFSENKSPVEVVNFLNTLFAFMIEIVNQNNGIINKFLGDGFMAVFGAPISNGRDCYNAVKASREILSMTKEYIRVSKIPPTKIGIGLHSGNAVTGNVGSELRKEYTVIGDVVNLASRIEQLTKQYEIEFLMTEDVFIQAMQIPNEMANNELDWREIDTVRVKGRITPVKIFTLV